VICDHSPYQRRLRLISPVSALINVSSLKVVPEGYLSVEIKELVVRVEEKVVVHEVHRLRDASCLVLLVLALSVLLVEVLPVSTLH